MGNFLFCSLSPFGFLLPSVGIAIELRKKGHEVAFVTDLLHSELLAKHGLRRFPRGAKDGPSFEVGFWANSISIAIQVKHIEYALKFFSADVLVGQQLTLGPLIVRELRKIPVGLLGLSTYLWPYDPAGARLLNAAVEEHQAWTFRQTMAVFNQTRELFKLPPCQPHEKEIPLLGDLLMLRSIAELESDIACLPERVHLAGACLWEEESSMPELDEWLNEAAEEGVPVIYVQMGRLFEERNFWPNLMEALSTLEVRVVAEIGRMDCKVGILPPNFLARPFMPQARVLRQAKAMIATPTTTPVLGSLTSAVPSLLIHGTGGEQMTLAERCRRSGTARILSSDEASAERIRSELKTLLYDSAVSLAVQCMADAFARVEDREYASGLLEKLLYTGMPVNRSTYLPNIARA